MDSPCAKANWNHVIGAVLPAISTTWFFKKTAKPQHLSNSSHASLVRRARAVSHSWQATWMSAKSVRERRTRGRFFPRGARLVLRACLSSWCVVFDRFSMGALLTLFWHRSRRRHVRFRTTIVLLCAFVERAFGMCHVLSFDGLPFDSRVEILFHFESGDILKLVFWYLNQTSKIQRCSFILFFKLIFVLCVKEKCSSNICYTLIVL